MKILFIIMLYPIVACGQSQEFDRMLLNDLKNVAKQRASLGIYEQSVARYKRLIQVKNISKFDISFIAVHEHGEFKSLLSFWIEKQSKDRLCGAGLESIEKSNTEKWISMFCRKQGKIEKFDGRLKRILSLVNKDEEEAILGVRPAKQIDITIGIGNVVKSVTVFFYIDKKSTLSIEVKKEIDEIFKLFCDDGKIKREQLSFE